MKFANSIEEFFERDDPFHNELLALRELFLSTALEESFKWRIPNYCINGKNVAGIASFKNYVGIWFHQGVFLKDEQEKLVNAQEEKTKAMRQWRFTSLEEIEENKPFILAYLEESIVNQKLGKVYKAVKKKLIIPKELSEALNQNTAFKTAFNNLSEGKKKEYAEHISSAKRAETKLNRIAKMEPLVMSGAGLYDKYK